MDYNILNFKKINDTIATAGQPTEEQIRSLRGDGYNCIINIAPYDKRYSLTDEQGLAQSLDIDYIHLPVDFANPLLEDYEQFESILKEIHDKKTLIHCAANYRVSVFFSHYASKHLNWSERYCNEHISSIWDIEEYPVWRTFLCNLRSRSSTEEAITEIIGRHRVSVEGDLFEEKGKVWLQGLISKFTNSNKKIQFVLPGFPFKSPNKSDKTFGSTPDMGEYLALEKLDTICDEINRIYSPGCALTIVSDGTTFNDIINVDEDEKNNYRSKLRHHAITHNIKWMELSGLFEKPMPDDMLRVQLVKNANSTLKSLDKFIERVNKNKALRIEHDKWCSYLYNDMSIEHTSTGNRDEFLKTLSEKAYQVMHRSKALSANIERRFPGFIRLSVHQYDNAGPKITTALSSNTKKAVAPWHTVPLLQSTGNICLMPHGEVDKENSAIVTYEGDNWFYLSVPDQLSTYFKYEIVKKPRIGLIIHDDQDIGFDKLSKKYLEWLAKQFGFVLIKGLVFDEKQDLVDFARPYGDIYQWQFGPVHVIKVDDNPSGFVHSKDKLPLHWDLSMLPLDHKNVVQDEYFCNRLILLYCKKSSSNGGGETNIVDSRSALRLMGEELVSRIKNTNVTYYTKMTYFGGVPRTYPMVWKHPSDEEWILRYQEGSDLEVQQFKLSSDQMDEEEFSSLIRDINSVVYDERCMVSHNWEENDLLLMDNYYTLHGRQSMSNRERELWRVQVI